MYFHPWLVSVILQAQPYLHLFFIENFFYSSYRYQCAVLSSYTSKWSRAVEVHCAGHRTLLQSFFCNPTYTCFFKKNFSHYLSAFFLTLCNCWYFCLYSWSFFIHKGKERRKNWNFHMRFFQLLEGLMELWEYIYIRTTKGFYLQYNSFLLCLSCSCSHTLSTGHHFELVQTQLDVV